MSHPVRQKCQMTGEEDARPVHTLTITVSQLPGLLSLWFTLSHQAQMPQAGDKRGWKWPGVKLESPDLSPSNMGSESKQSNCCVAGVTLPEETILSHFLPIWFSLNIKLPVSTVFNSYFLECVIPFSQIPKIASLKVIPSSRYTQHTLSNDMQTSGH